MGGKSKAFFKSKRGWGEEEMGRRGEEGKRRGGEDERMSIKFPELKAGG